MTSEKREAFEIEQERKANRQRAVDEGQVLRVTVYLWFEKDCAGDDPLQSVYTPYEAARDIESTLKGVRGISGSGLKYDALQVAAGDVEWGRIPGRLEDWSAS